MKTFVIRRPTVFFIFVWKAEAKAAVGDDFSGTSEVGDIDWNEVDDVLQQPN